MGAAVAQVAVEVLLLLLLQAVQVVLAVPQVVFQLAVAVAEATPQQTAEVVVGAHLAEILTVFGAP